MYQVSGSHIPTFRIYSWIYAQTSVLVGGGIFRGAVKRYVKFRFHATPCIILGWVVNADQASLFGSVQYTPYGRMHYLRTRILHADARRTLDGPPPVRRGRVLLARSPVPFLWTLVQLELSDAAHFAQFLCVLVALSLACTPRPFRQSSTLNFTITHTDILLFLVVKYYHSRSIVP